MKIALAVVAGAVLIILLMMLLGGVGMMGSGSMGMGSGMMGNFGGLSGMMSGYGINPVAAMVGMVFRILFMVGLVALIVWLVRNANRSGFPNGSRESPLDILKTRYAKGEITKEQFDAIKRDLGA